MKQPDKQVPLITILTPVYNEASILEISISRLQDYITSLEDSYEFEFLIVNDGSKDESRAIADQLAVQYDNVRVVHHQVNRHLGGALRTGFHHARGEYVVVLDIDLSYAPEHISRLLEAICTTGADMVVASPYMPGGTHTAVPFLRRVLSRVVNRFIRMVSSIKLHTFTGMVRVYRKSFLDRLDLKSMYYDINAEIIQKAIILRALVIEIPGHLDWSFQREHGEIRVSSIKIYRDILSGFISSYIFRPYMFFLFFGTILLLISIYVVGWIFLNTLSTYTEVQQLGLNVDEVFIRAIAQEFREHPHAFIVGSTTLILALQILSLGFLSLQSKRYFDELFHINTTTLERIIKLERRFEMDVDPDVLRE